MKAGTSASVATIRGALNKLGLHGQTPLLTTWNIKDRLKYAKRNLDKTTAFYETVLWTYETKLELFGHTDQRYVQRAKGQACDQKNNIRTIKQSSCCSNLDRVPGIGTWHRFPEIPGHIKEERDAFC